MEIIELLPIYALDAVEIDERAQIDSHLVWCDECQRELAGYQEVVTSFVSPVKAADDLWQRVSAAIGL